MFYTYEEYKRRVVKSTIFCKILQNSSTSVEYIMRLRSGPKGITKMNLTEYVNKVMQDKGLSAREVARRSTGGRRKGISAGYVNKICQSSEWANLTISALQSLAHGLGVSEDEIFDIARRKPVNLKDEVTREQRRFAEIYASLSPLERARFKIMADSFLLSVKGEGKIIDDAK
jgi:transcriptional regulator with XRE-family HTH domain